MGSWFWVLLAVVVPWGLQVVGTQVQMSHHRGVLGGITREGGEGYVGAGNARARFGKGAIPILVSGEDGVVKRTLRMRGMTVFARSREAPDLGGLTPEELRDGRREGPNAKATMLAARRPAGDKGRRRGDRRMNPGKKDA